MAVIINGTSGITDVNGTAAAPAITGTDTDTGVFFGTNTVSLSTGGTERLQVDSSGNLGLGVTPSAWASTYRMLQIGYGASVGGRTAAAQAYLSANWYTDGTANKYIYNGYATQYQQDAGAHYWFNAASGTAGNAITFTQAMTLDASGKLVLGGTSTDGIITLGSSSYGTGAIYQSTKNNGGTFYYGIESSAGASIVNGSSAYASLLFTQGATSLQFGTNNNIRATIDSSGNLLVGTTTSTGKVSIVGNSSTAAMLTVVNQSSPTTAASVGLGTTQAASASAIALAIQSGNGSAVTTNNLFIYTNGNVVNTNNSYGPLSDVKLKENIVDATPKLADLMQVRIVNYNLRADLGYEPIKQIGVIAQELEQVFPGLVSESPDRDDAGNDLGTTTKQVKMSVFVPMLIKAMQEQQALIAQLQADVAALKGTP